MPEIANKIYLSHINGHNKPANRYQEEVLKMSMQLNRMITEDPSAFVRKITMMVNDMHQRHLRCSKIAVTYQTFSEHSMADSSCSIGEFLFFDFLEIKGKVDQGVVQPFIPFGEGGVAQ